MNNALHKKPDQPKRKTLESHINRSEISRKGRLKYLAKNPAPHIPFLTMRVQHPIVEAMRQNKPLSESWGHYFIRIHKQAGEPLGVELPN